MREKGLMFLTEEFQLIIMQGIRKLQSHHQANTTVIVASKMNAKSVGKSLRINRILHIFNISPPRCWSVSKRKIVTTVERPSRHSMNK